MTDIDFARDVRHAARLFRRQPGVLPFPGINYIWPRMEAKKNDLSSYRLLQGRFRWIQEVPFNR